MDDSLFDDQERSGNEPFAPFEAEMVSEQRHISFDGDELLLVLLPPQLYFSLPSLCTALAINTRGQLQRIQRTPELEAGLRQLPLRTRGGTQRINCLLIEKIVPWLAGVQTRGMNQLSLNKLERYRAGIVTAATSIFADYEPADLPRQTILPFLGGDLEQSLALPALAPDIDQEDLRTVLTNIPYLSSSAMLITTNYQEDRAIREATLARKVEWRRNQDTIVCAILLPMPFIST